MTETSPATATEEPSIEEILASIRKIISDEPEAEAAAEAPSPPKPPVQNFSAEEDEEEEILDLAAFTAVPAEPSAEPLDDMDLDLEDYSTNNEAFDSFPQHLAMANARMQEPDPEPGIASPETLDAAAAAISKLQRATEPSYSATTQLWVGARTIEQVVEDLLRPILKTWLDQNLPKLVERLVEKELARMSKRLGE